MRRKLKNYKTMLQSCNNKIIRQGFCVLADQCGYSLITFIISILLARACSKETYGTFVLAMTIVFFSKILQRSLITVPFSVFYPHCNVKDRGRYLSHSIVQHLLVTALLVIVIGLVLLAGHLLGKPLGPIELSCCVLLLILCSLSADFIRTVMITRFKYRLCLIISVVIQACMTALLAFYYGSERLTVSATLLILCGGYGLFVVGGILGMNLSMKISPKQFVLDIKRNFKLGKWILSSTLVNYVGLQFLPWVTLIWWDRQVVATVGVLSMLTCVLRPLMQAMTHYLTPRFSELLSKKGFTHVRSQILFIVHGLAAISLCFIVAIYFMGNWFVSLIYGPNYAGYQWVLVVFSVAASLRFMNAPLRAMMTAMQSSNNLVIGSLLASSASLVLATLLIPTTGIMGIALVHLIYNLVTFTYNCTWVFSQEKGSFNTNINSSVVRLS